MERSSSAPLEARSFKRTLDQSLDEGSYSDPRRARITLRDLWEEFDSAPPRPLAASTRALYRMQWRTHVAPRLGDRRLNSLEAGDLRHFIADLQADGVGIAMIDSCYRLVRSVLNMAVRDRRIPYNPAAGITPPRGERREYELPASCGRGRVPG